MLLRETQNPRVFLPIAQVPMATECQDRALQYRLSKQSTEGRLASST